MLEKSGLSEAKVLIIDNIGMLSSLYAYGEIAYIGGGFGAGIHNTLEAAAWGLPVIFGPNHDKFSRSTNYYLQPTIYHFGPLLWYRCHSTRSLVNGLFRIRHRSIRKNG